MFTYRDTLETAIYCASTVVIGTGILFSVGTFDTQIAGFPTATGNFVETAQGETGRVTDLRDCDTDAETGTFYEIGDCADHETIVANTYGTMPYPQKGN